MRNDNNHAVRQGIGNSISHSVCFASPHITTDKNPLIVGNYIAH